MINDGTDGIDLLAENTNRYRTGTSYGHTHTFQIERKMNIGDSLTIIDEFIYSSYYVKDFYDFKCETDGRSHSCSTFSGRLIKKL